MECTTCSCPHPPGPHYGTRGFHAPLGRGGAERGMPRRLCPHVRAHGRCARARRTSVNARRSRRTPWRCGPWQKGMPYEARAVSSRARRIPAVAGSIEPDDIGGPSLPGCAPPASHRVPSGRMMERRAPERSASHRGREGPGARGRCLAMDCLRAGMASGGPFVVGKRDQESANMLLERRQAVSGGDIPFAQCEVAPLRPGLGAGIWHAGDPPHIPGKGGPQPPPQRLPPPPGPMPRLSNAGKADVWWT